MLRHIPWGRVALTHVERLVRVRSATVADRATPSAVCRATATDRSAVDHIVTEARGSSAADSATAVGQPTATAVRRATATARIAAGPSATVARGSFAAHRATVDDSAAVDVDTTVRRQNSRRIG